jgi:hypothetical protein
VGLAEVDWGTVVAGLAGQGWVRLAGIVTPKLCDRLIDAAPGTWSPVPEHEPGGSIHVCQAGLSCNADIALANHSVRSFANSICDGINAARADASSLPSFNHAQWGQSNNGVHFITPHRDPPGAGGVIAIATLRGRAPFYVWDDEDDLPSWRHQRGVAHSWQTGDGDLVLLKGAGWPTERSRCPVHEVESPESGDRVTLTLRHNRDGYGADYFA